MKKLLFNGSGEFRHLWKFIFSLIFIFASIVILDNLVRYAKISHEMFNSFSMGLLLGCLFCLKVVYKADFRKLGMMLNKKNIILLFAGILVPFFVNIQMFVIDRFIFHHSFSLFLPEFSPVFIFSFISFVIAAAAEETFFRAFLIGYFRDKFNLIFVFLFSATLFSMLHAVASPSFDQNYFIAFLLSGIFYGLLYLLTNSFYFVLSAHAFHNTFQLYPVNNANTKVYILNQVLSISYILLLGYYYRNFSAGHIKHQEEAALQTENMN
ncbi:MAG: lysostaphin resistance A-like protein [Bacillota bacterium]